MRKIFIISSSIILIISGFLYFLTEISNKPCDPSKPLKYCVQHSKYGKSFRDVNTKYSKNHRNMRIFRIIIYLLMFINGILVLVLKKNNL